MVGRNWARPTASAACTVTSSGSITNPSASSPANSATTPGAASRPINASPPSWASKSKPDRTAPRKSVGWSNTSRPCPIAASASAASRCGLWSPLACWPSWAARPGVKRSGRALPKGSARSSAAPWVFASRPTAIRRPERRPSGGYWRTLTPRPWKRFSCKCRPKSAAPLRPKNSSCWTAKRRGTAVAIPCSRRCPRPASTIWAAPSWTKRPTRFPGPVSSSKNSRSTDAKSAATPATPRTKLRESCCSNRALTFC